MTTKLSLKLDESNDLKSGIYQIVNLCTGQFYIGSSMKLSKRKANHFWLLRNNKHSNQYLQRSFDKYGQCAFRFYVIESVAPLSLLDREQQYLNGCWDNCIRCFNVGNVAEASARGTQRSPEARARMSQARKGKRSTRKYLVSEATKAKLRHSLKGNKNHLGKKHSEETRKKMSEAKRAPRVPCSQLTKARISAANKGKRRSPETIEKLRIAALRRWSRVN